MQLSSYGRYVDRVERRDGGPWLIADRICVFESTRVFTGKAPPVKPEWTQQQRSQDDPIFKMRREAGIDTCTAIGPCTTQPPIVLRFFEHCSLIENACFPRRAYGQIIGIGT